MNRLQLIVSGRVQGVGYRIYCREAALEMDVTGWVRNRSDGTVELEVQGNPDAVERYCAEIERGPAMARVTGVVTAPRTIIADEDAFAIRS